MDDDACCWCCFICTCVNSIFNAAFEEVIDHAKDGMQTQEQFFESQENTLCWSTQFFRLLGVFLNVLGLYLIFTPIIVTLGWIPLVGVFLSSVAAFAAVLVALIAGVTMSVFVMAMAWLFFRPLMSLTLITLASVASYVIFNWEKVVSEVNHLKAA